MYDGRRHARPAVAEESVSVALDPRSSALVDRAWLERRGSSQPAALGAMATTTVEIDSDLLVRLRERSPGKSDRELLEDLAAVTLGLETITSCRRAHRFCVRAHGYLRSHERLEKLRLPVRERTQVQALLPCRRQARQASVTARRRSGAADSGLGLPGAEGRDRRRARAVRGTRARHGRRRRADIRHLVPQRSRASRWGNAL
jgi:hypothetical protein